MAPWGFYTKHSLLTGETYNTILEYYGFYDLLQESSPQNLGSQHLMLQSCNSNINPACCLKIWKQVPMSLETFGQEVNLKNTFHLRCWCPQRMGLQYQFTLLVILTYTIHQSFLPSNFYSVCRRCTSSRCKSCSYSLHHLFLLPYEEIEAGKCGTWGKFLWGYATHTEEEMRKSSRFLGNYIFMRQRSIFGTLRRQLHLIIES